MGTYLRGLYEAHGRRASNMVMPFDLARYGAYTLGMEDGVLTLRHRYSNACGTVLHPLTGEPTLCMDDVELQQNNSDLRAVIAYNIARTKPTPCITVIGPGQVNMCTGRGVKRERLMHPMGMEAEMASPSSPRRDGPKLGHEDAAASSVEAPPPWETPRKRKSNRSSFAKATPSKQVAVRLCRKSYVRP